MKHVLKIFVAPAMLLTSLCVPFFLFLLAMTGVVFRIASALICIGGAVLLITGHTMGGIAFFVIAFLMSPYGLPMFLASLIGKLETARLSLKAFILS